PTPARLATASTLKPAQPRSPKSKIAASAILRSTSGSRGRPAAGASTCSTPHPSLLDEFRAAQPGRTRRRGRPGRGVARCPRTTAPADSATGVTNRNGGTGTAPSRAPLSGLHLAQGVAMRTKMTEMLGVEHPIVGFNRSPAVVAEVSKAGGFGVLAATAYKPDELDAQLTWIEEQVGDRPYGIDLLVPN